jgi:hypothetical protein
MGQVLLQDFTLRKIMLSAIVTGILGPYFFERSGQIRFHIKAGSLGASGIGGLIFSVGMAMALLGCCPGTIAGAVGQGSLDALLDGVPGMVVGSMIYAFVYPSFNRHSSTGANSGRTLCRAY